MTYTPKNYDHLLGLTGFSDQLLKNHFTLYQGYVANTNKVADTLNAFLKEGKTGTPEYAELKRRFAWEFNGMRLHEYYFGNMTKNGGTLNKESPLAKKIADIFGAPETWEKDFKAAGTMRGIGWIVLAYDPSAKHLFNTWVNEHDAGHLAGAAPLLVMDVFEHAFMPDYGLKRADYIEAFFKSADWKIVHERFNAAASSKAVL